MSKCNKKLTRDFTTTLKFNYGSSNYFRSLSTVIQLFALKFNYGSSNYFRSLSMVIQLFTLKKKGKQRRTYILLNGYMGGRKMGCEG